MGHHPLWIAVLILLLAPLPVAADEVVLSNGDRLTGRVVSMVDASLTFAPDVGGEISLPWSAVSTLVLERPMTLELVDGTRVVGTVTSPEPGLLAIRSDPVLDPVEVGVEDVRAILAPDPEERPAVRTSGNVDVGGSLTRGNTRTDSYRASAEFEARTGSNRYRVGGEFRRSEEDDQTTVDETRGFAGYDHFFSERWFLNTNVTLISDEFRDLTLRTIAGAGVGYQIYERPGRKLSTNLGVSVVDENFETAPDRSTASGRWGVSYEESLFGEAVTLTYDQDLLLGLESTEDFLLILRSGLRFPIAAGVTGSLQAGYDFDNTPAAGTDEEDLSLSFSVGYGWGTNR